VELRVETDSGPAVVTISLGVAGFHGEPGLMLERLISVADDALYAAKAAGRNRVVRASETLPPGAPEGIVSALMGRGRRTTGVRRNLFRPADV